MVSHYGATKWHLIKINVSSIPINAQVRRRLIEVWVEPIALSSIRARAQSHGRFSLFSSVLPICANNLTHSLFRWVGTKGKPRRIDAGYYFSICAFLFSLSPAHLRRASSRTRYTVVRRQIVTFRIVQTVFFLRAQSIVSSRFPAEIHTKQIKFSSFICFFSIILLRGAFALASAVHCTERCQLYYCHSMNFSVRFFSSLPYNKMKETVKNSQTGA